jgi:hypothetical protein
VLAKKLAGAADIVQGIVVSSFAVFTVASGSCGGASGACPGFSLSSPLAPLLVVGILLLVAGVTGILEKWPAFPAGIVLSLVTIAVTIFQWGKLGGGASDYLVVTAALALVDIILNVRALMSRPPISEENHPLNLPVFG